VADTEQQRPDDRDVARQAAIQSLVSNLVYLALILGFTIAVSRRDAITRLALRWRRWRDGPPVEYGTALHELRRDIARLEGREPPS
jgi:hypothetical protein